MGWIKNIFIGATIIAIMYGLYFIMKAFPLEAVILFAGMAIFIIAWWALKAQT